AKLMELHRPSISEIEGGGRNVSAIELTRLAQIYSVDLDWLVCESGDSGDSHSDSDAVQLAARELSKLKDEDLQKVLRLLSAMRREKEPGVE
ncbi:MAG: helix-turn-helix transcriptional regulator, partial [Fimbriimonadaceae bacterium]